MLWVKFKVDDAETLKQLRGLSVEAYVEDWAEAIRNLAEEKALTLGENFGKRIAKSVEQKVTGLKVEITPSGPDGYIGVHAHTGGPINIGKTLAIPLPNESTKIYNPKRLFAKQMRFPMFKLTSKAGNELLFRKPGKGKKLEKPLFVLKDATAPQRPRPWWPDDAEVEHATEQYFDENF